MSCFSFPITYMATCFLGSNNSETPLLWFKVSSILMLNLDAGSKEITDWKGDKFTYTGELDHQGKACGKGTLTNQKYGTYTFEGTFLDDKMEGIGKQIYN